MFMGKYFGTDGFRGEANVKLTVEHAYKVGRYLGWYFKKDGYRPQVVIGKDTRRSSYMFEYSLVAGLTASGADVSLLHVTTTPSVSYVVRTEGFDCGIMISACHNPFYDNGIKLINRNGQKMEAVVEENLATAKGFIFDGFPRTQAQGEALDALLAKKGLAVSGMLALEVEDEVLVGRLLERGKTSGRADDADESVIRARIAEYYEKTNVLKDFYSAQGKYHGVDGVGSIPEIADRLSEIVDKL
jgi:adenylate kinase family enzyme